jgi:uncharacterized protein YndB with AHSA1/START domain
MINIMSDLHIRATPEQVFRGVTSPSGLDAWWTSKSAGEPRLGESYTLDFGPGYVWEATVVRCDPPRDFELELTRANPEWTGTRVRFQIESRGDSTILAFNHTGWEHATAEYRTSCYCWPMYLRLLRRNLEHGELVPYERRLDV